MKDSYSIEFVFGLNGRSNFASISPSHFEGTGELCTITKSPYRLHYMVDWARLPVEDTLTIEDTFHRVMPNTRPKEFRCFPLPHKPREKALCIKRKLLGNPQCELSF